MIAASHGLGPETEDLRAVLDQVELSVMRSEQQLDSDRDDLKWLREQFAAEGLQ